MAKDKQNYMNNPNLPTVGAEFEYTPKMVKDLKKCKQNILYFAENFFYIISLDEGKQTINLHSCQKRALRKMRDNRFFVLLASRQIGKALALDTPVPSPNGWTSMGEIKDGDVIYDSNGQPCNVIKAHDILYDRVCYEVEFDNGEKIVADAEHNWFTQSKLERRKKINGSVKTTQELFETVNYYNEPMHRIPTSIEGVCGVEQDLPIDPWVLGFWLGDGDSSTGSFTVGKRDIDHIKSILDEKYNKLLIKEYNQNVFTIRASVVENIQTKSLSAQLRKEKLLKHKHIPDLYLKGSREQRLELLKGLIDSDGYISRSGICQFYNTNIQLVKQVKQLTESLGYKVTYKEYYPKLNNKKCSLAAHITFTPIEKVATVPFKVKRICEKEFINKSNCRAHWHYIKKIKEVNSVPVRCITVDSEDSLFLVGKQYIPTKNTTMMTIYALWIACFNDDQRILIVANKEGTALEIMSRIRMAYEELPNWLKPGVKEYGKTSIVLANGTKIGISTTTGTAARGQSVNCVDGSTVVTLRDKETQTVFDVNMKDLADMLEGNGEIPTVIDFNE